MNIQHEHGEAVTVGFRDRMLFRYVYSPDTPADQAPKPFFHPVHTLSGNCLTNLRPNDHPWHHALCHTITRVGEANFWGGPSYREDGGYQFRDDNGRQVHREWLTLGKDERSASLEHRLDWIDFGGATLLEEIRGIGAAVVEGDAAWVLTFSSNLRNVAGRHLDLGNYHSSFGLAGSHYTGLLMRMTREYVFPCGDPKMQILAAGGLVGVDAVHGANTHWAALSGRHDESLDRTTTIFVDDSPGQPVHWFVRDKLPAVGFSFQYDRDHRLEVDEEIVLRHRLIFAEGALEPDQIEALVSA